MCRRSLLYAVAAIICLQLPVTASAQEEARDEAAEQQARLDEAIRKRVQTMVDRQRPLIEQRMQITFAHLSRVCQLTEGQSKKLKLATKGAVEDCVNNYRTQMEARYRRPAQARAVAAANAKAQAAIAVQARAAAELAAKAAAQKAADAKEAARKAAVEKEARARAELAKMKEVEARMAFARLATSGSTTPQSVVEEKRWTTALELVLTDEQKKTYAAALELRRHSRLRLVAETAVSLVDDQVMLDDSQRRKLLDLMNELLKKDDVVLPSGRNIYSAAIQVALPILARDANEEVESLLDDSQKPAWSTFATRYARRLIAPARGAVRAIAR